MAFLQPDVLVDRLMVEINRIANTPCPLAEREQQIGELEGEIDRLQRTEEAIVVSTGAPREVGCPPWIILGVKAIEATACASRDLPRRCGIFQCRLRAVQWQTSRIMHPVRLRRNPMRPLPQQARGYDSRDKGKLRVFIS
jgi:hypothetical protein